MRFVELKITNVEDVFPILWVGRTRLHRSILCAGPLWPVHGTWVSEKDAHHLEMPMCSRCEGGERRLSESRQGR